MTTTPAVALDNVEKRFSVGGEVVRAVDGITLEVAAGEFVVVLGASGSGKTTLLHLIAGLIAADAGRIAVAGVELSAMSDAGRARFRRRQLGVIFQSFNLLPTLTAAENVALPLLLDGLATAIVETRVDAVLDQIGLRARRNHLPDELSGGECQRVAIARALVSSPALVLADEPTGNLDARTGRSVLELLGAVHRQEKSTVLLVTHDRRAVDIATRVVELEDGRVSSDTVAARRRDAGGHG